jgi:hypothetical protein
MEDNPDYWPFGEESNDELDELNESVGSDGPMTDWGRSRELGDEDDVVQLGEGDHPEQKKPRSAELQPGGARKSKKGGKKVRVKDDAANSSSSSSSKKASVAAITGGGGAKRPVVIPPKLQGSAYFKSYQSVKKAEQAVEAANCNNNSDSDKPAADEEEGGGVTRNEEKDGEVAVVVKNKKTKVPSDRKSKRSVRRGKVATMLEMVNKARRKLGDASSKSAAALPAAGSQTQQLSPGAQALLGGGTGAQSFAALGVGTSSPDSLFAPKMAATLPHFPAPPKMAGFGFGPLNNNTEYDSSDDDDDVNASNNHAGGTPPEMIQQELGDIEGAPLTGSLDTYFFASKDASEEGRKRFGTADFQNPNGDNSRGSYGIGLPHSPIDKNPRTAVAAPPPESAEERAERLQEEALNAECDMLLSRLEKRLGVASGGGDGGNNDNDNNGENQDNVQQQQQQSVLDTMPVSLSKIPVAASRIPVPKASKPRVPPTVSGKAAAAQQGGGTYNPPGGSNNPQQQPRAPPKPKPQAMDLAASYLQRLKQEEDAQAQAALSVAMGGRSDYTGDYSIGVDLPSFALPPEASIGAGAVSSAAATHNTYSKSLLEQWMAEDTRDGDDDGDH